MEAFEQKPLAFQYIILQDLNYQEINMGSESKKKKIRGRFLPPDV